MSTGKPRIRSSAETGMSGAGSELRTRFARGLISSAIAALAIAATSPMANSSWGGARAPRPPGPADDQRAQSLSDGSRHHIIADDVLSAADATGAHGEHLVARHAEHVPETQQH